MAANLRVDDYIDEASPAAQPALRSLREIARAALPDAEETIRYGIPTYRVGGTSIVHFAAWQRHVSIYPVPPVDGATERAIEPYRAGKGTLRFRLAEPLPLDLIATIIGLLAEQRTRPERP